VSEAATAAAARDEPGVIPDAVNVLVGEIEADLARRIEAMAGPEALREAVAYSVLGGGKRLRPVLTLLACESVGGRRDDARASAAAMELIHCFSLVHDDLPAMDDDDLRRGRPTLHVHAGEAMAILAGDVMMSLAFEWIADGGLPDGTTGRLTRLLAEATTAMIAGQVLDTFGGFPTGLSPAQQLDLVHRQKTAALIRTACTMGGVCGGASSRQLEALGAYGEAIGIMFQVVDDLLDETQTAEHIGKATGKDRDAGKLTWPGVHGLDACHREAERLRRAAHAALAPLGPPAEPLAAVCDYLAIRTR